MSQWTETIEKNLIAMQQNAKKLADNYLERYISFKNITTYLNVPLLLLSALNAYVIYDADSYSRGVQIGSSATSLGIAIIMSGEFLFMFRNNIENHFLKFKHFESLEQSIQQTLSIDRLHRVLDPDAYFEETFRKYKTLVVDDLFIMKYLGNLGIPEEITTEDIPAILNDHWNILFRPAFRRIKHKNQKVIEALKATGQSIIYLDPLEIEREEVKQTFSLWWSGIWKKENVLTETESPSPFSPSKKPNDVESCRMPSSSSFWKTTKDDSEQKSGVMIEMTNVYPEIIQNVIYEPIKRSKQ